MRKGRGTHFDPDVLDAFFEIEDRFAAIAATYRDAAGDGAGA
jgi:putative two-component system response regulator